MKKQQNPTLLLAKDGAQRDVSDLWWPGYNRESLAIGGDWRANTSFNVPLSQAEKWLDILGWELIERWGGALAFKGRVHTVTVNINGSLIVATLDQVWNAVRSRYNAYVTDESDELLVNGGFETADPTGAYVFEGWGEIGTDGTVTRSGTAMPGGLYSAAVTAGPSTNKQVGTSVRVRPGVTYDWIFWTRGSGTVAGRYEVRNNADDSSIVALLSTGVTGTTWTQKTVQFTAPAGCNSVSIRLRCPTTNGQTAYFDNASMKAYEKTELVTDWVTDDDSIRKYGRREREVRPRVITNSTGADALAAAVLARYANPQNESRELGSAPNGQMAQVSIVITGHVQSLKYEHYDDTLTTSQDADAAVTTTLAASSGVVTAGDIRANSAVQITRESDGEAIWSRLVDIAEFGDGAEQYLIGCYASSRLDYRPIDRNAISYYSEMAPDGQLRYFDAANQPINGALLRPGSIVWRRDLFPGRPRRAPFTNDIRATLIGSVRVQRGQVSIEALDLNEKAFLQAFINSISLEGDTL